MLMGFSNDVPNESKQPTFFFTVYTVDLDEFIVHRYELLPSKRYHPQRSEVKQWYVVIFQRESWLAIGVMFIQRFFISNPSSTYG